MSGVALPSVGALRGADAFRGRGHHLGGAVVAAVALHSALLLFRLGPSAASYAAPAAPVMAVRVLRLPSALPVAPAPTAARPATDSAPAIAALPAPAATERRPAERNAPAARSEAAAQAAAPLPQPASETAAAREERATASKTAAAEAKPAADKALPDAPDYAFGVRLDPGPRPLEDIEPEYPDPVNLREGIVVLRILISDTGRVDNVAVVRAEPRGVFEQAAIDAFAKARFSPGLAAGTPVKSQITVEVNFMPINRGARVSGRTY